MLSTLVPMKTTLTPVSTCSYCGGSYIGERNVGILCDAYVNVNVENFRVGI
jgi:hypothetical protein